MKSLIAILILLVISCAAYSQKKEAADTTAVKVTPGASGVKRSIGYKFSSATGAADPGNGVFRIDRSVASSAKYLIVDDIDIRGEDQTNWFSTWDKTTGASGRGGITVTDSKGKIIAVFNFTSVFVDADGYWKLPVDYVSGTLPADGSVCYYVFDRIAHKKPSVVNDQVNQPVVVAAVTAETVAVTQVSNQAQAVVAVPPVQTQVVVAAPPVQVQAVVTEPPVQVQAVVTEPPVQAQVVVAEPPVQAADTAKAKQANQGNQVVAAAVVTTGTVVAAQTVTPPRTVPGNTSTRREQTAQPTQSKPVQTTQPTQSKPVTQTTQPVQTKPVTQTTQTVQTKPITQATQPVQTTTVTQATVTTAAVTPAQRTQQAQQTQVVQSSQQVSANQPPPSQQYNQFPAVTNIFENPRPARRRWYRGIIEVGYGFGVGDYGINNFRFNFINAIRIGEFSSIGLGIGYRRLFTDNTSAPYLVSGLDQIPVFLDLRTSFSTRRLTPYLSLGVGGSSGSGSSETDKSLLLVNASGGIWYNFSPRFAVFAGIGYEMQKLNYSDTDPFTAIYNKNGSSISLNIGISF